MTPDICILFTITDMESLYRCAVKVDELKLPKDCIKYWREPENMEVLKALLPSHVLSAGRIVDVETIFEIVTV